MSYPLDPPRLGWGRNCVSLGTLSTLESPLLRCQRARSSSCCWIAAMVHRRGGSTAEMGAVGRLKCNTWRKGCGGMDAAPQSHVKSTKRSIQRSARLWAIRHCRRLRLIRPAAEERISGAINRVKYWLSLFISLFFTLTRSLLFGPLTG